MEGRVGDLIFYRRGNKTCCRSRPVYGPNSLSTASRQSAGEFGQASRAAKQFRQALEGLWPVPHDSGMVNRLNTALYRALRADPRPRGQRSISPAALKEALRLFRFNDKAALRFKISCSYQPDGVQVSLPQHWLQLLRRPRYASHVQVQAAALAVDAATGACYKTAAVTDCVALNAMHNGVLPLLPLFAGAKHTTVIVLQLRFIKEEANGSIYTSAEKAAMVSCIAEVLLPVEQAAAPPVKQLPGPAVRKKPRLVARTRPSRAVAQRHNSLQEHPS